MTNWITTISVLWIAILLSFWMFQGMTDDKQMVFNDDLKTFQNEMIKKQEEFLVMEGQVIIIMEKMLESLANIQMEIMEGNSVERGAQ